MTTTITTPPRSAPLNKLTQENMSESASLPSFRKLGTSSWRRRYASVAIFGMLLVAGSAAAETSTRSAGGETTKTTAPSRQKQSIEQIRNAAELGDKEAQYELAHRYLTGKGVHRDTAEVVKWVRLSAAQDYAPAQCQMGHFSLYGNFGITQNIDKAMQWYQLAATQGHAAAQNNLGLILFHGAEGIPQNASDAVQYFQQSAAQGYVPAMNNMGSAFFHGIGVTRDLIKAEEWFLKAARLGDPGSQFSLAAINDQRGDLKEAFDLYTEAAQQNHAPSQFNLAVAYGQGKGTPVNYVQSYMWFRLAELNGFEKAPAGVQSVAQFMNRSQISEGEERVREWNSIKPSETEDWAAPIYTPVQR